jgi:hypothetical protein
MPKAQSQAEVVRPVVPSTYQPISEHRFCVREHHSETSAFSGAATCSIVSIHLEACCGHDATTSASISR